MSEKIDSRMSEAKKIVERLVNSRKYYFRDLKPTDLENGLPAVYAIYDNSTGECLYVGRTKNLRRRLYSNHLMGPKTNARLKKYLIQDPAVQDVLTMEDAKQFLRDRCCFQYIDEQDIRRRGLIEGLLSFVLNVRYIHEEH